MRVFGDPRVVGHQEDCSARLREFRQTVQNCCLIFLVEVSIPTVPFFSSCFGVNPASHREETFERQRFSFVQLRGWE